MDTETTTQKTVQVDAAEAERVLGVISKMEAIEEDYRRGMEAFASTRQRLLRSLLTRQD